MVGLARSLCLLVRSLFGGALPAAENLLDLKVMILDLFNDTLSSACLTYY